jgi:hypothetical protein
VLIVPRDSPFGISAGAISDIGAAAATIHQQPATLAKSPSKVGGFSKPTTTGVAAIVHDRHFIGQDCSESAPGERSQITATCETSAIAHSPREELQVGIDSARQSALSSILADK